MRSATFFFLIIDFSKCHTRLIKTRYAISQRVTLLERDPIGNPRCHQSSCADTLNDYRNVPFVIMDTKGTFFFPRRQHSRITQFNGRHKRAVVRRYRAVRCDLLARRPLSLFLHPISLLPTDPPYILPVPSPLGPFTAPIERLQTSALCFLYILGDVLLPSSLLHRILILLILNRRSPSSLVGEPAKRFSERNVQHAGIEKSDLR